MRSGLWKYWWWHRLHGHRVIKGVDVLLPIYTPRLCEDCDVVWRV